VDISAFINKPVDKYCLFFRQSVDIGINPPCALPLVDNAWSKSVQSEIPAFPRKKVVVGF
jgi:hypothetical protein